MTLQERQNAFDKTKWYDSLRVDKDTCGDYEFCVKCRKTDDYPCARAAERFDRGFVRIAVIRCRHV